MADIRDWRNLCWPDFEGLDPATTIALQPCGAIEQHGPHLPVAVDALIAEEIARRAAARVTGAVTVLILPTTQVGKSTEHIAYPGTLTLEAETLTALWTEIGESVAAGAREIDIVITRRHVLQGNWQALYDEMREMRAACGEAHIKAILATGELGTLRNVARASLVCMMAGADFIKTSTGKESVNATLPVTLTMIRAIRDYHARTGIKVGYKPAGGISKAKDALVYLSLVKDELGDRWLQPDLLRFGASSLLGDIERQLEHHVTGAYSAGWRHAMA